MVGGSSRGWEGGSERVQAKAEAEMRSPGLGGLGLTPATYEDVRWIHTQMGALCHM